MSTADTSCTKTPPQTVHHCTDTALTHHTHRVAQKIGTVGRWRRRLECVVQQQGSKTYWTYDAKNAGCDSYFRQ